MQKNHVISDTSLLKEVIDELDDVDAAIAVVDAIVDAIAICCAEVNDAVLSKIYGLLALYNLISLIYSDVVDVQSTVNDIEADVAVVEQEVYEVEKHLHNRERWFGKKAAQTATDWGDQASLAPYRAISGDGVFGADTDDEALVIGADDTPAIAGMTIFDAHRILITAASNATDWVLRIIYGEGTMAAAESAGQYTDVMVQQAKKGSPIDVLMPRCDCAVRKLWVRAKNATNNATIDFFIGIHEYSR